MTSGLIKPKPEPETQYQPVSNGENDDEEPEEDDYDSEDDPLIPQPDVIGKRLRRRVADMPLWKFYLITIGILLFGFIIALLVDELEIGKFIRLSFQGADVSPGIRGINGIDNHLFHPSRLLLFQTLQERAGSNEMVCSCVGHIWSMRHGILVSRAVAISANIAVLHSISSAWSLYSQPHT